MIDKSDMIKKTNIFKYATSELSQDAFICFLCAHANNKSDLTQISRKFINEMLKCKGVKLSEESKIVIKRQYKNIDVLLMVDDINIIIEDKTFTSTHDNQVLRYKQVLIDEGVDEEKIICVYYKISEQAHKEEYVDVEFNRYDMIELLRKSKTINQIVVDYLEYLEDIEDKVNLYKTVPIASWGKIQYFGFFEKLKQMIPKEYSYNYKYVSNKAGGFSCFYIEDIVNTQRNGDWFYVQLENNQIVLKYATKHDPRECKEYRQNLLNYFKEKVGAKNKVQRLGKYMSVCHLEYDETNYMDKLKLMIDTLKNCNLNEVVYKNK